MLFKLRISEQIYFSRVHCQYHYINKSRESEFTSIDIGRFKGLCCCYYQGELGVGPLTIPK